MAAGNIISLFDVNGILALTAGILSFFSPCVLPLVPSYLIYISGITFDNYNPLELKRFRLTVLTHSLAFISGFSLVFVSLGLSSSLLGNLFMAYQDYISKIGGILLILMGAFYLGLLKLPFLNYEKVIHLKRKPTGFVGSFVVGITFSLGWTPCVGPALSSVLIVASTTPSIFEGVYLLGLYSLGLGIPFILSALLFDRLFTLLKRYGYIVQYTMKVLGVLLIVIGLLLFTSYYRILSLWITSLFPI